MAKLIKSLGLIFLFCSLSFATTVGSGSYEDNLNNINDEFDGVIYKDASVTTPTPSNTWWNSLLFSLHSNNMFAFPMCYKAEADGLIIGINDSIVTTSTRTVAAFQSHLKIQSQKSASTINAVSVNVSSFTDWGVTAKWEDESDGSSFTATMGQGFIFTYFEYADGAEPKIVSDADLTFYNIDGTQILDSTLVTSSFTIKTSDNHYYGVFLPESTTVSFSARSITTDIPIDKNYMSIAAMTSLDDLETFNNYAYNFITNTHISWSIASSNQDITTTYTLATDDIRTGTANDGDDAIIALMPHHYNNGASNNMSQTFTSIRGTLKLSHTKSFTTELKFNGITPFLGDPFTSNNKTLNGYLNTQNAVIDYETEENNLYFYGKKAAMIANLINVADINGNTSTRNFFITKLTEFFEDLLNTDNTYKFYYHNTLNSLIDYPHIYGSEKLNDHHFHYGYFIYAAAILAHYDTDFITNYGGMIELLIRDIASTDRSDTMFPYLRYMEIYEGHCYANGMGVSEAQTTYGPDQESSSEAMNAWAGIYLWGLMTNNSTYKELGMWGYMTEYSSIEEYWQNKNNIYNWDHTSVGIVFGAEVRYDTWFSQNDEHIYGIQMLPINPTSLYLAYDEDYISENYAGFISDNDSSEPGNWDELFYAYRTIFDYDNFSINYSASYTETTKSFLYYWNNHFQKFGKYIGQNYYCNKPSYAVFLNGEKITFQMFNPETSAQTFTFRNSIGGEILNIEVPANSFALHTLEPYNFSVIDLQDLSQTTDASFIKSSTTLHASWDYSNTDVAGYEVGISTTSYSNVDAISEITWVTEVTASSATLTDQNLVNGLTYYFYVRALLNDGTKALPEKSNGIIAAFEPPEVTITVKRNSAVLTEPFTSGNFIVEISIFSNHLGLKENPALEYAFGTSAVYEQIPISRSGDIWTGSGFITTTKNDDYVKFRIYDVEDLAGNTADTFINQSTFTVKNTFDASNENIIEIEDGSAIKIDPGLLTGTITVDILPITSANTNVSIANAKMNTSVLKDFAENRGIFKEFKLYENNVEISTKPVTIYIPYANLDTNNDNLIDDTNYPVASLKLFYFDPILEKWEVIQNAQINTNTQKIYASVSHLSIFAILLTSEITTLNEIIVYPNPYYSDQHLSNGITIANLPQDYAELEIKVYDISGRLVRHIDNTQIFQNCSNYLSWDVKDSNGDDLATGVYIILVRQDSETFVEKIAIIQ